MRSLQSFPKLPNIYPWVWEPTLFIEAHSCSTFATGPLFFQVLGIRGQVYRKGKTVLKEKEKTTLWNTLALISILKHVPDFSKAQLI